MEVPTIRGLSALQTVEEESASADLKRSANRDRPRSLLRTSITAILFTTTLVAGVLTARWGVIRFLTPTPFSIEDEIREGEQLLTLYSPSDTWDAWQYYQEAGFREKLPSNYYRVKRAMEQQDETMKIGAVVTLLAFVGLMAMFFWPQKK